jgi:tRNA(His) 5'-end guanylyltransferase
MNTDLKAQFDSFELFGDEKLMRGFIRVCRLDLMASDRVLNSPQYGFAKPFDQRYGKLMVKTASHLLGVLGEVIFGVAQIREISVLLAGVEGDGEELDGRRLICNLASEASSKLSLLMEQPLSFEARLYEFPSPEIAKVYFVWRQQVNEQFTLDRYFKFALLASGTEPERIAEMTSNFDAAEKKEILSQNEIKYDQIPLWQKRGVGLYWRAGVDDAEPSLMVDTGLPTNGSYEKYLGQFL